MQTQYIVSHQDKQSGPYSVDEIVQKLNAQELGMTDYLYDEAKSDWVMLMECAVVTEKLGTKKPKAPPRAATPAAAPVSQAQEPAAVKVDGPEYMGYEWYVLKGENKFGPFAYVDLIKMLQEKKVFEFDYVWHSALSTWTRIAEIPEFQPKVVRSLKNDQLPEISEVFFRRRHKRASFNASILVHDNRSVWKGEGIEISAGGAGLYMENAMLVPGQTLFLHFKPGDGIPPFNATCEIVSKKFVKGLKDRHASIKYGVKFVSIAPVAQEKITQYTQGKAA